MRDNTVDAILFLEKLYNGYQHRPDIALSLGSLKPRTMLNQPGWSYILVVTDLSTEESTTFTECFMPQAEIDKYTAIKKF